MDGRLTIAPVTEAERLQALCWVYFAGGDRSEQLLLTFFEGQADIWHLLLHNLSQQWSQVHQGGIIGVIKP